MIQIAGMKKFNGKYQIEQRHYGTRRERPKSAPYLRLKNVQGTTIGKIWKKIFFFQKIYF